MASASACATVATSITWRSRLRRSSSPAIRAHSHGSSCMSSSTPSAARPMRPPALIRGPKRKPRCQGSGGPPSRATSIKAVRPGLSRRRSATRPLATKARLRPVSGTTSAIVPSATRSRKPKRSGSGRSCVQNPRRRSSRLTATTVMNTRPTAASWPSPERSSSRLGLTTASATGKRSSAR